jgi:hypothetical protein
LGFVKTQALALKKNCNIKKKKKLQKWNHKKIKGKNNNKN